MINFREVLNQCKIRGEIKGYSFQVLLTQSYYIVLFNDGIRVKLKPVVGKNQNVIQGICIETKTIYEFAKVV